MNSRDDYSDVKDIFVAREPIFDDKKRVYGYQLLFKAGVQEYVKQPPSEERAALKVISNTLTMGINQLTGGKKAFIVFNKQLLITRIPRMFPMNLLAVEIREKIIPDAMMLKTMKILKQSGYQVVFAPFVLEKRYSELLPFADVIKIDFHQSPHPFREAVKNVESQNLHFLADNLQTDEEYREARELGYRYFQGNFFRNPDVVSFREIPGHKFNYLQIIKKVCEPILPVDEIEMILKRDVSLTYKLLRFINSASYGFKVTVRSVRHALTLLGKREVKKWLTIIALSGICSDKSMELMRNAILRARFCELIGQEFNSQKDPTNFFLLGMFSLADSLLDQPMEKVLEGLPLEPVLKSALLGEKNLFKDVLDLVLCYEKADWESVSRLTADLDVSEGRLAAHYIDAVQWTLVV